MGADGRWVRTQGTPDAERDAEVIARLGNPGPEVPGQCRHANVSVMTIRRRGVVASRTITCDDCTVVL